MSRIFIGVDVSQDHLDVHVRPTKASQRFANTTEGIAALVVWIKFLTRPSESSSNRQGLIRKPPSGPCWPRAPAVVVNARQVRDFCQGHMNYLAKTDAIDGYAVIAHFAEVATTKARPLESQEIRDLRELYDRRGQLVRMLTAEKTRRHSATVSSRPRTRSSRASISTSTTSKGKSRIWKNRMDAIIESSATFQESATRSCNRSPVSVPRFPVPCSPSCPSWVGSVVKPSRLS